MQFLPSLLGELDEEEEEEVFNPTIRRIYERREPLTYFSNSEFKMRFRMDKESAISIVDFPFLLDRDVVIRFFFVLNYLFVFINNLNYCIFLHLSSKIFFRLPFF